MKRIASILLTAVLAITSCGIGVFADDAKAAEQPKSQTQSAVKTENAKAATTETKADAQSSDAYDITKWNFHLDKTTFEYGVMKDKAKSYYGKHDEIAREKNIYKHLKYTAPNGVEPKIGEDITFEICGENSIGLNDEIYPEPGKHTLLITAENAPFSGSVEIPFTVAPFKVSRADLRVESTRYYSYNGKSKKPGYQLDLRYKDSYGCECTNILWTKEDYNVTYKYSNNKKIGTGTTKITAKFKGDKTGTVVTTGKIIINPGPTKITKLKVGKKSMKIKWKKQKGMSGYKVKVCQLGKDYGVLKVKTYTIKGNKKNSITIKKLKRHTKYCVYVDAYKRVKGKTYNAINWKYKWPKTK